MVQSGLMSRATQDWAAMRLQSVEVLQLLLPIFEGEGEDVAGGMAVDVNQNVAQVAE